MGFFNDAFQAIKGGIGGAVKTVIDPKNILNAATGNLSGVAQNALGNILGGIRPASGGSDASWNVSQPLGSAKHDTRYPISSSNHGMTGAEIETMTQYFVSQGLTYSQAQTARNKWLDDYGKGLVSSLPAAAPSGSSPQNAAGFSVKNGGLTGNPTIDAAIGGALSGIGTQVGGTDVANNAANAVGSSAITQWLKTNWWKAAAGLLVLGTAIYFMIRKPKRAGFRR